MKQNTPLRLVAIDSDFDDDSAVPVVELQENEAVTRKVPNPVVDSETIPATPRPTLLKGSTQRPYKTVAVSPQLPTMNAATQVIVNTTAPMASKGRPFVSGRVMMIVGLAVMGMVAGGVLFVGRFANPPASPSTVVKPSEVAGSPNPSAVPTAPTVVPSTPVTAIPLAAKPVAEAIRLQVTAQPIEAKLSLDGNVVAGHSLNLKVPRDHGIHVISASAPGYIPFNQQVSFDSDVVLSITLRRSRETAPSRPTRSRPVAVEQKPKLEAPRTPAAPVVKPSPVEPGMNLEGPVLRNHSKSIDERNPYKL